MISESVDGQMGQTDKQTDADDRNTSGNKMVYNSISDTCSIVFAAKLPVKW